MCDDDRMTRAFKSGTGNVLSKAGRRSVYQYSLAKGMKGDCLYLKISQRDNGTMCSS